MSAANWQLVDLKTGGQIALQRLASVVSAHDPVILVHGSVSNSDSMRDLADHLLAHGIDCWLLDWGGHGRSKVGSARQNFETAAMHDVPAAIAHVLAETGRAQCHWVSHSGGGHILLMYLCRHPNVQSQLASCVIMGAQATDFALSARNKLSVALLWLLTMVCGRTPARMISMATETEPSLLLAQWASWNLQGRWRGRDGFDYLQALSAVRVPALVVAGGGDRIAPLSGCRKIYDALGSDIKQWIACTMEAGFSGELRHGQLVRGRAAREEIDPRILAWLRSSRKSKAGQV